MNRVCLLLMILVAECAISAEIESAVLSCAKDAEENELWKAATNRQLTKAELLRALAKGPWLNVQPCESYNQEEAQRELLEILSVQAQELLRPSGLDIRPMLTARLRSVSANVSTISGTSDALIISK